MNKLWQKGWNLDSFIESFETKDDLLLDQKLIKHDAYGSIAHAKMLEKIGVFTAQEMEKIINGLLEIVELAVKGKFSLKQGDEDVHTKIENFLIEISGDVGKKINTGRSRNDQILTDLRLYTKEQLLLIWRELLELIRSFYEFSKKYEFIPIPGYTHMQRAMPSSVGMWSGAFIESLLDDLNIFKTGYSLNNKSPLGSAAGYGVPLPLDREYTNNLLGFKEVQINSLYCQNSRGKVEAVILSGLCSILQSINRFATDVLLFTTKEFGYFRVSNTLCSGSSIMPQKANVDIAELLRSKIHIVIGYYLQLISLSSNLPSGYNRDLQDSKKPLMESLEITKDCIKAANVLINNLEPHEENLKKTLTPEIFATHKALELVKQGIPFRQAYQIVGANMSKPFTKLSQNDSSVLKQSTHIGGTGNLCLDKYLEMLKKEKEIYNQEQDKFNTAINNLLGVIDNNCFFLY